jgi:hypothetical protein
MGTTVLLSHLSAPTELLVINLVTQQDPESDPQLHLGLLGSELCRANTAKFT